jgi:hypothetical protein
MHPTTEIFVLKTTDRIIINKPPSILKVREGLFFCQLCHYWLADDNGCCFSVASSFHSHVHDLFRSGGRTLAAGFAFDADRLQLKAVGAILSAYGVFHFQDGVVQCPFGLFEIVDRGA